jgi:hypothetical protein
VIRLKSGSPLSAAVSRSVELECADIKLLKYLMLWYLALVSLVTKSKGNRARRLSQTARPCKASSREIPCLSCAKRRLDSGASRHLRLEGFPTGARPDLMLWYLW